MTVAPALEVRPTDWAHADAAALRDAQQAEIAALYGVPDSEPGPKPSAADITAFFVAYRGDEPVGCGGLRAIDAEHGEIKRMYVAPDHRGSGVSTAVLRRLEDEARARGWSRLVLETGTEQHAAVRFYEREGYVAIPRFGHYADSEWSLCYEKRLGE
jgi:GNAT superfamily N-acetyltransferase